ncbi:response regulator [[Clostridium] spiroforme]|nr:response regulator [Thomasclavelia spiroformis]
MINIAIVDDDINFIKMVKKKLVGLEKNLNVFCYTHPFEFIENLNNIDYVLLDIDLPQIDGITLSKQLKNSNISIFFITSYAELMIKAFGKNVEGFILKDDLDRGINNFLTCIKIHENERNLTINYKSQNLKIGYNDILYIKYSLRDVEYFLTNNNKIVQRNTNLKDIYSLLSDEFMLINRSMIVNINYVNELKNGYVYIRNQKYRVSRRKIKFLKIKLLERIINYDI